MQYFPGLSLMLSGMVVVALMWPPKVPYVVRKGSDVHETIWLWRVPAYLDHPAWYVRWSWRDGVTARAYCFNPQLLTE